MSYRHGVSVDIEQTIKPSPKTTADSVLAVIVPSSVKTGLGKFEFFRTISSLAKRVESDETAANFLEPIRRNLEAKTLLGLYPKATPSGTNGTAAMVDLISKIPSAAQEFKYTPNIICIPYAPKAVIEKAVEVAEKINTIVVVDADTSVLTGGSSGQAVQSTPVDTLLSKTLKNHDRLVFSYPNVVVSVTKKNAGTGKTEVEERLVPSSAYMAAVLCKTPHHISPSNKRVEGIVRLATPVGYSFSGKSDEVDELNAKGVSSFINFDGEFRVFGGRTTSTDKAFKFINVRRTADLIQGQILKSFFWAVDANLTLSLVDTVLEEIREYLSALENQGVILGGRTWFDQDDNTTDSMTEGRIVFRIAFTPAFPVEEVAFKLSIVNEHIKKISAAGGGN